MVEKLAVLGSTGSIGVQTLRAAKELNIRVDALTANSNVKLLAEQTREFLPAAVAVADDKAYSELKVLLSDTPVKLLAGESGVIEAAVDNGAGMVLNAIVGMAGLTKTLAAIEAKKDVALANKESLVAAGSLVLEEAKKNGVNIIPVDSEHSAIFQCCEGNKGNTIRRVILTASGGPFFGRSREELMRVKVSEALHNPNWSMGKKITVDSATLMNKGLELIEAVWLFSLSPEQVEVHIHRESIVHSAVEFMDGAVIAELSVPDMALPIRYALTYPERKSSPMHTLDLFSVGKLTFSHPDEEAFGCLPLAREAILRGGLCPAILNAANEAAVELFLSGKIGFLDIERLVREAIEGVAAGKYKTLIEVQEKSKEASEFVLKRATAT